MHPFLGWVGIAESSLWKWECLSPDPCHRPPQLVDGIVSNLPQRLPLSYDHSPSTPCWLRMLEGDMRELFERPLILSTALFRMDGAVPLEGLCQCHALVKTCQVALQQRVFLSEEGSHKSDFAVGMVRCSEVIWCVPSASLGWELPSWQSWLSCPFCWGDG